MIAISIIAAFGLFIFILRGLGSTDTRLNAGTYYTAILTISLWESNLALAIISLIIGILWFLICLSWNTVYRSVTN